MKNPPQILFMIQKVLPEYASKYENKGYRFCLGTTIYLISNLF